MCCGLYNCPVEEVRKTKSQSKSEILSRTIVLEEIVVSGINYSVTEAK